VRRFSSISIIFAVSKSTHVGDACPERWGQAHFTVGLTACPNALRGYMPSKQQQALKSIHIEQNPSKKQLVRRTR
jgi:hypothetical protein